MSEPRTSEPKPSHLVPRIVLAWTVVGLPLLWGVSETVKKALLLFR